MHKDLIKFNQITNKEKLSQNTINTITQDREGFMWFGSQDGLNRYDGYDFKIYKKNSQEINSLSENYISTLYEDKDFGLWIGTSDSGIVLYDKMHDEFIKNEALVELSNEYITSIAEDNESNVWISTFHNGLFKFSKTRNKLDKINFGLLFENNISSNKIDIDNIMSIMFDEINNKMYVGIWNCGLYLIDLEGKSHKHFCSGGKSDNSLVSNKIRTIFKDSNQNVWIGTHDGLSKFSELQSKFINYQYDSNKYKNCISGNDVRAICEDKKGYIWIGTYGNGLNRFDINKDSFINFKSDMDNQSGFVCNTIFSLYSDKTGVLWIGTLAEGLLKFDSEKKCFFSIINRNDEFKIDERNKIKTIHVENKNNLLIGTINDGLYIYKKDNESNLFSKHQKIDKETVYGFLKDNKNNIWIANETFGLSHCNFINENYYNNGFENIGKENLIYCIGKTNLEDDFLLIGTKGKGLKIYDISKNLFFTKKNFDELNTAEVRAIFIDSNHHLWIATHLKGLILVKNFSLMGDNFEISEFNRIKCDNTVWCIHEDAENNIWIGTASTGLNKIDLVNNKIYCFTEENGLCNNCVHGILEDDRNNLWLSTSNGISVFNKKDRKFKNFDSSDGLNNIEFNEGAYFKYSDGTMYFGGNDGITYFHPSEIKDNPYIPNIVITDFEIFNEPVTGSPENPFLKKNITYADEINLTYRESVFSFRFAALIFNNPQKNQYAYKMEGFDKDWTYCGPRKRVTYTNLNPGDYVFKVKGSNNDGIWNEEGTSIKITITPPYWKTWWFKSLGFLGVIAATGYQYRQRLEKLEKESKAQEEFSRKLIESQENERKRIAHSLHDTIAHEVTISKNKAMMALKHKDDPEFMQKALEEISEMASSTITDVRNISYDLHPHQLERLGFTKAIRSIVNDVSKSTNIKFVFETDNVDEILSKESEINLFRVIQESITNIIKHSMATEATLRVSKLEDYLLIVIIDNGKGFDVNSKEFIEAKHGFGIEGILERVKFMNGEIKVESEINKGTTLRFKIPIKK